MPAVTFPGGGLRSARNAWLPGDVRSDQWHGPQTVPQRQPWLSPPRSRSRLKDTVRFVADLGKHAGRCHQRIRDKLQIAHPRGPLHLRTTREELALKATAERGIVVIIDRERIPRLNPLDGERYLSRYRDRATAE